MPCTVYPPSSEIIKHTMHPIKGIIPIREDSRIEVPIIHLLLTKYFYLMRNAII